MQDFTVQFAIKIPYKSDTTVSKTVRRGSFIHIVKRILVVKDSAKICLKRFIVPL